jgi:hypothetical protein
VLTIIKANGNSEERSINKIDFSELQKIVGGYVEYITIDNERCMLVNEDGIRLRLPSNRTATIIYGQPIVGDVAIVDQKTEIV